MNLKQVISIIYVLLSAARVQASSVALRMEAIEVNDSYALLTAESTAKKELDVLRSIAIEGIESEYEKWKVAIKNDWLKAFLVYEAIEAQKFRFALKVFNEISTDTKEFDAIKLQMKEGTDMKYEWILVVLEKAIQKVPSLTMDMKENVFDLRRAIVSKIHDTSLINLGVPSNVANSIKDGQWVAPYAALVDSFIHSEVGRQYYYSDDALKQAIEADKPSLVNLLLMNHAKINSENLTAALTNLRNLNLYVLVKSPLMIRQLKKFRIPILWDFLHLRYIFPNITPESKRSEMLNLMKLTTEEEKKRFKDAYDDDDTLTVREAMMTGDYKKLSGIFLRDDIGVYKKEWIPLSIKFCGLSCFDTLLRERVPLPEADVLEQAYKLAKDYTVQDYKNKMEAYSKYYKDNKCIDGPLGCDKEKYDAWFELNNPTDAILKKTVEHDKHEIIGKMIKNYMSKKGKNPENEEDIANNLGKLDLYKNAKSPEMVKKLIELKVPLVWDHLYVRNYFVNIWPESKRSEIMNMLKLSSAGDKKRYKELYGGNDNMTMEEAIKTGSWEKVMGLFMRKDIGLYQKDWFKLVIKYGNAEQCLTLLNQRVPFLEEQEFEATLNTIAENKRQAFRDKWNRIKIYYKDNKCTDGPLGCDKEKYEAWLRLEGFKVTNSTRSASGGSGSGGGGGSLRVLFTSAAATNASECNPLS